MTVFRFAGLTPVPFRRSLSRSLNEGLVDPTRYCGQSLVDVVVLKHTTTDIVSLATPSPSAILSGCSRTSAEEGMSGLSVSTLPSQIQDLL